MRHDGVETTYKKRLVFNISQSIQHSADSVTVFVLLLFCRFLYRFLFQTSTPFWRPPYTKKSSVGVKCLLSIKYKTLSIFLVK